MVQRPNIATLASIDRICSEAEHEHYNADAGAGAARADSAQDFANVGTMFPDEALHIDPFLNIEWWVHSFNDQGVDYPFHRS